MPRVTIDTVVGPRTYEAPWEDMPKNMGVAWVWLLNYTATKNANRSQSGKSHAEIHSNGAIEALSRVLASGCGMAPFFWTQKAEAQVKRDPRHLGMITEESNDRQNFS